MMGDASVRRATGRGWDEWFAILDTADAFKLPHKAIAEFLVVEHDMDGWWAQSVTVSYERARGLRMKHQTCDGSFSANASKTVHAPLPKLFAAWADTRLRGKWLTDARLVVRKRARNKSIRMSWNGGPSRVGVYFFAKGASKSQVAVGHDNLPSQRLALKMKAYWRDALQRLALWLENDRSAKPQRMTRP